MSASLWCSAIGAALIAAGCYLGSHRVGRYAMGARLCLMGSACGVVGLVLSVSA